MRFYILEAGKKSPTIQRLQKLNLQGLGYVFFFFTVEVRDKYATQVAIFFTRMEKKNQICV